MSSLEPQEMREMAKLLGCQGQEEDVRKKLARAKARLQRVQRFGSAYSKIEFSPYVRELLDESTKSRPKVTAIL